MMALSAKVSVEDVIRNAGLRATSHRKLILKAISDLNRPVTAYELVSLLGKKTNIDQATIYRNFVSLRRANLLRRLDFNHGHAHYELETGKASNQLVCNLCETVEKIDGISMETAVKKILRKSKKFKDVTLQSVELYGLCRTCAHVR